MQRKDEIALRAGSKVGGAVKGDGFWESLLGRLLHPVQVQIIEAMLWIDRRLSPRELELVFDREVSLSSVAYHVRRLADLDVLVPAGTRRVRGAVQRFYRLFTADE